MIRHPAIEAEPAEPAMGEVEVHFLAQPPLRRMKAVTQDRHPDHQLRVDRTPARLAVVRAQVFADARQIHRGSIERSR